jgi:hypothetical protein
VAPGATWTPLIPATMPAEEVRSFGGDSPMGSRGAAGRDGGGVRVLASDEATYVTGETITVTGGRPLQEVVSTCPRAPSTTRHERRAETTAGVHRGAGTAAQRVSPQRWLRA